MKKVFLFTFILLSSNNTDSLAQRHPDQKFIYPKSSVAYCGTEVKGDTLNATFVFQVYGHVEDWPDAAFFSVAQKWGIVHYPVSCQVTKDEKLFADRYNERTDKLLAAEYGANWYTQFYKEVAEEKKRLNIDPMYKYRSLSKNEGDCARYLW